MGATISWNGGERHIGEAAELLKLLDEIEGSESDESLDLVDILPDGADTVLTIGLGRSETVLSLTPVDGKPPFFASKGDPSAEGLVHFFYRGAYSEFPRWSAIPIALGNEIAAAFVATGGQRPTQIEWEPV